jgi:hypothetical protein
VCSSESWICCPRPLRSRSKSAAQIAIAAAKPEVRSITGVAVTGAGAPCSSTFPSAAMNPEYACATMSDPARVACGPWSPKPVTFA